MGIQIKEKPDETITKWIRATLSQFGPMTSNDLYFRIEPGVGLPVFRQMVYKMVRDGELSKMGHRYKIRVQPVYFPPATRIQIIEGVGRMVTALAGRLPQIMFAQLGVGGGSININVGMTSPFKLLCCIKINVGSPTIDTKQLASLVEWVDRFAETGSIYPLPDGKTTNPDDGLFHTLYY